VPKARLAMLLKTVAKKVPPLSKTDEADLLVRLPILGAALEAAEPSRLQEILMEIDGEGENLVRQLLQDLTDYALSSEHLSNGRKAAASCAHAILKNGFVKNPVCPVKPLIANVVSVMNASRDNLIVMMNCVNFLSVLVSSNPIELYLFLSVFISVSFCFHFPDKSCLLANTLETGVSSSTPRFFVVPNCRCACSIHG
jgi:hypothetical protein